MFSAFKLPEEDMNEIKHFEALYHVIPSQVRKLRACLLCSLVKSIEQFQADGCENCDDFLHLRQRRTEIAVNFMNIVFFYEQSKTLYTEIT